MRKKLIIGGIIAIGIVAIILIGLFSSDTLSSLKEDSKKNVENIEDLESGFYYVEQNGIYKKASFSDYTFVGDEMNEGYSSSRAIFFDIDSEDIPTVTSNNDLLFISKTDIPEGFTFERFRDDGVSIGLSNLIKDESNHYYFPLNESDVDDYKGYIDTKSDVKEVTKLENATRLYIDQVGDLKVAPETVSKGGVITGLEKDKEYIASFYIGTLFQDFKVRSNIHTFTTMEDVKSYSFDFMHSNVIKVEIPKYFKSGYYLVNGIGFFRYIADADKGKTNVNMNDPMIIYDEYGFEIYNPSDESYQGQSQSEAVANANIGPQEPGGE